MNEFTRKIITGNPQALLYAKSLLTDPMLTVKIGGVPFAISLQVETSQQNGSASVSEQLVVTSEGKKFISDNVAPGPWTWTVSGYISGAETAEPTNYFKPTVQFLCDIVRKTYKDGLPATYKDMDCCLYSNVVIQDLTLEHRAECKDRRPFTMTLKQIEVLKTAAGTLTRLEALSNAVEGSAMGTTNALGQTASTSDDLTKLYKKMGLERFE